MVPSYEPEKTHLYSESTQRVLRGHSEGTQRALRGHSERNQDGHQMAIKVKHFEGECLRLLACNEGGTQHAMTHLERASVASPRTAPRWRDPVFTAARRCPDCKLNFSSVPSSPPK